MTGLYIGLISGTSMDGIDAALVTLEPRPKIVAATLTRYPAALRDRLEGDQGVMPFEQALALLQAEVREKTIRKRG